MPKKEIAGTVIDVDENGYMTDMNQWTPEIAKALAKEIGIELTDRHFEVINYLRELAREGKDLSIRKIGKSGVVTIKEFYALFPDGPLKKAALVAGLPKPKGCV